MPTRTYTRKLGSKSRTYDAETHQPIEQVRVGGSMRRITLPMHNSKAVSPGIVTMNPENMGSGIEPPVTKEKQDKVYQALTKAFKTMKH